MALVTTEKYVKFQNSKNPSVLVNLNSIVDVAKEDISAPPNAPASSAEYWLVFTMREEDSQNKTQIIKYDGNVQRDADFNTFVSSTTLVI